jgi:molybdopterin-binding protein
LANNSYRNAIHIADGVRAKYLITKICRFNVLRNKGDLTLEILLHDFHHTLFTQGHFPMGSHDNILTATVEEIRLGDGPGAIVRLRMGDEALLARITRRSVQALGLGTGYQVFAVLKSVSVAQDSVGATATTRYGEGP